MTTFSLYTLLVRSFCLLSCFMMLQGTDASCRELSSVSTRSHCPALPAPMGKSVEVDTVDQLKKALSSVSSHTTILLSDGKYNLNGYCLILKTPYVTLRSRSGTRDAVVLDGNYTSGEIIQIAASNVTIADITISRAYNHAIHIYTTGNTPVVNSRIYNVHIVDPGQQAIKINPASKISFPDNGEIACSHIELTEVGRSNIRDNCYTGGIDAHRAGEWVIRDNLIEGFWCKKGLSEHAVHYWGSSNDTIVERNILGNNARGVGFGMTTTGTARVLPNNGCPDTKEYVDHFGGVIRNNFIYANSKALFASEFAFDNGISLWQACRPKVLHNTIYSADPLRTFSSIEWRFPSTHAEIINNLVNVKMLERDGANAAKSGNIENVKPSWFVDAAKSDLHLSQDAVPLMQRVKSITDVIDDIDGDTRKVGGLSDVGTDEFRKNPR